MLEKIAKGDRKPHRLSTGLEELGRKSNASRHGAMAGRVMTSPCGSSTAKQRSTLPLQRAVRVAGYGQKNISLTGSSAAGNPRLPCRGVQRIPTRSGGRQGHDLTMW